jgi:hypothetical protein
LPTDYLTFILEEPWWSFPRAITKAFTCLDFDSALVGCPISATPARSGRVHSAFGPTVNPPKARRELAPLAQSAERLHGKEKVYGSIP